MPKRQLGQCRIAEVHGVRIKLELTASFKTCTRSGSKAGECCHLWYFARMCPRNFLSAFGRFFLVVAFLCAPIANNGHAIRMQQNFMADAKNRGTAPDAALQVAENAPCHEAMAVSLETSNPGGNAVQKSDTKEPCCPHEECSPENCLIHFAIASLPLLETIPHSRINSRTFKLAEIHLVSMPFTERLRPPIA